MPKYRKRPVDVDAEQWFSDRPCRGVRSSMVNGNLHHTCVTAHGQVTHVAEGDWVIAEPAGRGYYPCKPDIFEANYDPVLSKETHPCVPSP